MCEKEGTYEMQIYCEESPRSSGWAHGDAAADVEGNGECYGSGGAREAERWREDGRKKKKEEGPAMPIYKEIGERVGAKIEGDQSNDYPAKWMPRFSENI